jgi:hypothetical protein
MPLNDADRAWVKQEIQTAQRRHGLGKFTGFLKDWSGFGAFVAVLLLISTQWTAYVEFRTNTQDRLTTIEKNLTQLALQKHASLSQESFEKSLGNLKEVVGMARKENLKVSPDVVESLQSKLADTRESTRDFWPTAASFVSYRSFALTNQAIRTSSSLPNCRDTTPKIGTFTQPATSGGVRLSVEAKLLFYEDCRVTLDSPEDGDKLSSLLREYAKITFNRCLVVYHGGPIKFTLARQDYVVDSARGKNGGGITLSTSGETLSFVDCLFDFSFTDAPSPEGQQLTKLILDQKTSTINLPAAPRA